MTVEKIHQIIYCVWLCRFIMVVSMLFVMFIDILNNISI